MEEKFFKLTIAYDGTNYSGWQKQRNAPTIQEELEKPLSIITSSDIILHGAGRTDAGVHALGMTAHFKTRRQYPASTYLNGLNSMLPHSIRVLKCEKTSSDFHARFSATGKHYRYHIFNGRNQLPTKRLYSLHIPRPLNTELMGNCLDDLVGTYDFSTFEASGSRDMSKKNGRGAVRTIHSATLTQKGEHITIDIIGDGFLRHMVRNIVGTVNEVGGGQRSFESFQKAFIARNRSQGGATAAAKGLFLVRVLY